MLPKWSPIFNQKQALPMQFVFEHNANALLPFLDEIGRHIHTILPGSDDADILVHRCKFILTELCTNGIKHSGQPHSIFNIYVEDKHLVIQRKDRGMPFHPTAGKKGQPVYVQDVEGTITLTEDDINRLNMQRVDEHSVKFYVEEVPLTYIPGRQKMNEHFGLIIICRSSDRFVYSRLPDGLNVFTVFVPVT